MSFEISASGMMAQRLRTDIIAQNLANANTTRPEPYYRKVPIFAEHLSGVRLAEIFEDRSPDALHWVRKPGHPDANDKGFVLMPNISPVREMVNLIEAVRAYEANQTALDVTKQMMMRALDIGRA